MRFGSGSYHFDAYTFGVGGEDQTTTHRLGVAGASSLLQAGADQLRTARASGGDVDLGELALLVESFGPVHNEWITSDRPDIPLAE